MFGWLLACVDPPRSGSRVEPDAVHSAMDSAPEPASTPPAFTVVAAPTIQPPADPFLALVATLRVETSAPTTLAVTLDDGLSRRRITFAGATRVHERALLGLRPEAAVTATVTLTGEDGSSIALEPVVHEVPPVPFDLPDVSLLVARPGGGEGVTWLPAKANDGTVLLAVDATARVVWARHMESGIWAVTPAADATVSMLVGDIGPWVLDLGGGWRVAYDAASVPTAVPILDFETFTHEATPMPGGGFVTLHAAPRVVERYPYETLRRTRTVTIDDPVVVEFDAAGATVHQWSLADRLSPTRIGYDANNACDDGACDWGHANAVIHELRDDTYVVSLRHQDAVVKLDRGTGAVRWILGNHDGWPAALRPLLLTPVGEPFAWPYHQHAPMPHPADPSVLVMFDNGNHLRTTPYADNPGESLQSQVVAYRVDEAAQTITQEWEYVAGVPPEALYSHVLGNADWLGPDGDRVLATWGSLQSEDGVRNLPRRRGDLSVRVIELDVATGSALWDLSLSSTLADRPGGWNLDRAVRAPSLYGDTATETLLDP